MVEGFSDGPVPPLKSSLRRVLTASLIGYFHEAAYADWFFQVLDDPCDPPADPIPNP